MIPAKYRQIVFGLSLSMIMSLIISGVSTASTAWGQPGYLGIWAQAWLSSWVVAFPAVLVVGPIAHRIAGLLVRRE